jgi:hypothetical protein
LWQHVSAVNAKLPEHARQRMIYPRISEMLANDSTEGIHSELTFEVMKRYFTIENFRALGGAVAHPLISDNAKLFGFISDFDAIISDILASDWDYLCEHPESTLMAYWIARPDHSLLADHNRLAEFTREEDEREGAVLKNGGYYYPDTPLHHELYPRDRLRAGINGFRGKVRTFLRGDA